MHTQCISFQGEHCAYSRVWYFSAISLKSDFHKKKTKEKQTNKDMLRLSVKTTSDALRYA